MYKRQVLNVVVGSTEVVVASAVVVSTTVVDGSAVVRSVVDTIADVFSSVVVVITTTQSHNGLCSLIQFPE